ncbi:GDP-mannose 4,6-dehydratase, partial [filamentous cyanobacterium LEGE 11480]|nr:GDP-mannose 4,6-dehydratase [Romeriopsis navalis LEGE 11480]MBE9033531.1 GDP-mannose 4,6-dehydratase [Romeriopsis navalis LEGE 11480]
QTLGWEPELSFVELVNLMVDADLRALGLESPTDMTIEHAIVRDKVAGVSF